MTITVEVHKDYKQFFLLDGEVQPLYPENITNDDIARRYKLAANLIAVYTAGACNVTVELVQSRPLPTFSYCQHVGDLPLDIPSGKLIISRYPDYIPECPVLTLEPGRYIARILYQGNKIGANEGYVVELWPSIENE